MPKGDSGQHAHLLLKKGLADEAAVRVLVTAEVDDSIIGFHAQQAVEKSLKAVLAARGAAYPWTHDIRHLMELLEGCGAPLPDELSDARRLTPWAAEFSIWRDHRRCPRPAHRPDDRGRGSAVG